MDQKNLLATIEGLQNLEGELRLETKYHDADSVKQTIQRLEKLIKRDFVSAKDFFIVHYVSSQYPKFDFGFKVAAIDEGYAQRRFIESLCEQDKRNLSVTYVEKVKWERTNNESNSC